MEKILKLPEYHALAEDADLGYDFGGDLCPIDPGSIKLLDDLYGEFLPLLTAKNFNACCDETRQIGRGRTKRRAAKIGVGRVYLEFVLKIHKLCRKHGKRMNMWGDIIMTHPELIPEVPKDIVMLNWDYNPNGQWIDRTREFAEAGLPLVCCPGVHGWQSHGTRMAAANHNITKFARIARECSAEGLLNTDWGDGGHRNTLGVSLHGFALGAACAWGGAQVKLKGFTEAFTFHTFGDRTGKLAAALKTLGAFRHGGLYHALIEPLDPDAPKPRMHFRSAIAKADLADKDVARRLAETRALKFPKLRTTLDDFEAIALEEFDLARRMDETACRRIIAGRKFRAGKPVNSREMKRLADDGLAIADDLAAIWRKRNRPSRLRDNLAAIRAAAKETAKLAR